MDLTSETILSSVATGLVGVWLIRQSVIVSHKIDVFDLLINWLNKNSIILPSFLFLVTPFAAFHLIQQLGRPTGTAAITAPIDRVLTIFATASSIFIGNRYLEGFRKKQEQRKVARLLVSSIQVHLEQLGWILVYLRGTLCDEDIEAVNAKIRTLQNDSIYESALKQAGVFDLQDLDVITRYALNLNSIVSDMLRSYDHSTFQDYVANKTKLFMLDAKLCIIVLSKRIIQDENKFYEYKELAKNDYIQMRFSREITNNRYNPNFGKPLRGNGALERTEVLFEQLGLITELENSYSSRKIKLEKLMEADS